MVFHARHMCAHVTSDVTSYVPNMCACVCTSSSIILCTHPYTDDVTPNHSRQAQLARQGPACVAPIKMVENIMTYGSGRQSSHATM